MTAGKTKLEQLLGIELPENVFQPISDLFSAQQLTMLLMAWLPLQFGERFKTGNYAIDLFTSSAVATLIVGALTFVFELLKVLLSENGHKPRIAITVDHIVDGLYEQTICVHHTALSWLISEQSKKLKDGAFLLVPKQDEDSDNEEDDYDGDSKGAVGDKRDIAPKFTLIPQTNESIYIKHGDQQMQVRFIDPNNPNGNNDDSNNGGSGNNNNNNGSRGGGGGNNGNGKDPKKRLPSIVVESLEENGTKDVDVVAKFVRSVTQSYLDDQKTRRVRSRYERNSGGWWNCVQAMHTSRGLGTVALDYGQMDLLRKDLDTFLNDREFYARIGMPYRRGYLLHGKPGTGKTSLINAISAHLNRDLYYINLRDISDDAQLNATFSSVPAGQMIVFEDIDTQSTVTHSRQAKIELRRRERQRLREKLMRKKAKMSKRGRSSDRGDGDGSDAEDGGAVVDISGSGGGGGGLFDKMMEKFALSTLLGNLDGHTLAEGTIIIMTTNHVEVLDPAVIRPGRMDLRLELGYASHLQIQTMYRAVMEDNDAKLDDDFLVKHVPERIIPPCEIMMAMVLYRREPDLIPNRIKELAERYRDGPPPSEDDDIDKPLSSDDEDDENEVADTVVEKKHADASDSAAEEAKNDAAANDDDDAGDDDAKSAESEKNDANDGDADDNDNENDDDDGGNEADDESDSDKTVATSTPAEKADAKIIEVAADLPVVTATVTVTAPATPEPTNSSV